MILTVIIRDEAPWSCQEPATYRTVHIDLTEAQHAQLATRATEFVSQAFLEPAPSTTTAQREANDAQ